jgi:hypothetical protein
MADHDRMCTTRDAFVTVPDPFSPGCDAACGRLNGGCVESTRQIRDGA